MILAFILASPSTYSKATLIIIKRILLNHMCLYKFNFIDSVTYLLLGLSIVRLDGW